MNATFIHKLVFYQKEKKVGEIPAEYILQEKLDAWGEFLKKTGNKVAPFQYIDTYYIVKYESAGVRATLTNTQELPSVLHEKLLKVMRDYSAQQEDQGYLPLPPKIREIMLKALN